MRVEASEGGAYKGCCYARLPFWRGHLHAEASVVTRLCAAKNSRRGASKGGATKGLVTKLFSNCFLETVLKLPKIQLTPHEISSHRINSICVFEEGFDDAQASI